MKKIIYPIAIVAITACSGPNKLVNEANRHYDNMEYHTAAVQYEQYLKNKEDHKAAIRLAECYMHMNHFSEAEKSYAAVIKYPEATPQNELQYAHILKHNGKYEEARKWYVEYLLDYPNDEGVTNELRSCDSLANYTKYTYQYNVFESGLSSVSSDFSPVFYKNGIVFCSERSKPANPALVSQWTGHAYLDLYFAPIISSEEEVSASKHSGPLSESLKKMKYALGEPTPFSAELNSAYNEGPACFTRDGNTIYFTRNLIGKKNKLESNKESINNFEIYKSTLTNNVWSAPEQLSFDNKDFSVGHPALSRDEKRIYFVSDKPGGFGGTDIYYSDLVDGKWSEPVNAGPSVNTNENEMFPVINLDEKENEYLYYSTEGKPGMGGLDMYVSQISCNTFSKPSHLNAPLNSAGDDFGMIVATNGLTGYFSTNRDQADGSDKIVAFKKYIPEFFVEITVVKKGTTEIIPETNIEITDLSHKRKENTTTNAQGKIFRKIDANSELLVRARKDNFFAATGNTSNIGKIFSDTLHLKLELDPIVINKPIRLDNIYYDYDKWDIRPDATPPLDKLVKIMKENPGIHVELSSHTDARGKDAYNMKLSQKRAESAVAYIIAQGINAERIYAKGYGESKLLNRCKNGVKCSEEEHQLNRRTEFKVVRIITEVAPTKLNP